MAQKTSFLHSNYVMLTFNKWLSLHTPDQLIVQAVAESPNGLTRRELRERFPSLSYETFLDLLDAFIGIGVLSVAQEGDDVRYWARTTITV